MGSASPFENTESTTPITTPITTITTIPTTTTQQRINRRLLKNSILAVSYFSLIVFGILSIVIWISGYYTNTLIVNQYSSLPGTLYLQNYTIRFQSCASNKCQFELLKCLPIDTTYSQCYYAYLYLLLLTPTERIQFSRITSLYNTQKYLTNEIQSINNTQVWYNLSNPTNGLLNVNPIVKYIDPYIIMGSIFTSISFIAVLLIIIIKCRNRRFIDSLTSYTN